MKVELTEGPNRWGLTVAGRLITQCCVDYGLVVSATDSDGLLEVRIEGPFEWQPARADRVEIDPQGSRLGPVLAVVGKAMDELVAFKDGRLELHLSGGDAFLVSPREDYEAWTVAGPRGLKIVSMPGGDLAIWTPQPDNV